jgi:ABC-type transport system involved in multi-copper enzyme maturation permease subunit
MSLDLTLGRRMAGAEFLKLRKKRSLVIWSTLLAVGTVVVFFGWRALHASPGEPPVGGLNGFARGLEIVGVFMGPLAAVLIGAEAGAGDSSAGVFRDLVVTGRSRAALFAARVPGALALCTIVVTIAYLVLLAFTFALAGGGPTPSASLLLQGLGWSVLVDGVVCVIALGLASATLSRPATITALIGLELVASPLMLESHSLGNLRKALLDASVLKLAPALTDGAPVLAESLAVVLIVIAAWVAVALTLGAWRTRRVDT